MILVNNWAESDDFIDLVNDISLKDVLRKDLVTVEIRM